MDFFRSLPAPGIKNYRTYLSLLFGAGFGLSIYSYGLVNFLPPVSRQIIFYTFLASLAGALGYFLLLELWIVPQIAKLTPRQKWVTISGGVLMGVLLTFAGTTAWKSSTSYLTFLLPSETLKISVPDGQGEVDPKIVIGWITTSVGDVSYDSIDYQGWKRNGDELVLVDPENNSLTWTGKTGDQAVIVFRQSPQGRRANISWNGVSEDVNLFSEVDGKYVLTHRFSVPFYASRSLTLLLFILNLAVVSCSLNLVIWNKRKAISNHFQDIFQGQSHQSVSRISNENDKRNGKNVIPAWGAVSLIMILAALLRALNLENLNPYTDEYAHLLAAKALVSGAQADVIYQRSLYIVTLPVAFFFRVFGVSLWSARLAGVVFNVLAIIPLYLGVKKINRDIAIWSCALYALSPWIIAVSRNVREYAYYPFYFYWTIYAMIVFLEKLQDGFIILRDWKKILRLELAALGAALTLPVVYGLVIDPTSTFKVILISYGVFLLFLLRKFDLRDKVNIVVLAMIGAGTLLGAYILAAGQTGVSILPSFDGYPIRYFLPNPQQQWYFGRAAVLPVLALLVTVSLSLIYFRINSNIFFFFLLYLAYMLFFTFFFNRFIRPRYFISAQFWYIVLVGIGFYGIWSVLRLLFLKKTLASFLGASFLLAMSFNVSQILLPVYYSEQGYMPITEEYHDDIMPAYSFLFGKVKDDDVLISTIYRQYARWVGSPAFKASYPFNYNNPGPRAYIFSIVEQYDSGWVVIDARRYDQARPLPLGTIFTDDKKIEYMGRFSDQYIWRWSKNRLSP